MEGPSSELCAGTKRITRSLLTGPPALKVCAGLQFWMQLWASDESALCFSLHYIYREPGISRQMVGDCSLFHSHNPDPISSREPSGFDELEVGKSVEKKMPEDEGMRPSFLQPFPVGHPAISLVDRREVEEPTWAGGRFLDELFGGVAPVGWRNEPSNELLLQMALMGNKTSVSRCVFKYPWVSWGRGRKSKSVGWVQLAHRRHKREAPRKIEVNVKILF